MRIPAVADKDDGNCLASSLLRLKKKCRLDQERLYCHINPSKKDTAFPFKANHPMGHNTVSNLFKGAVKDMGLDMTDIRGADSLKHHMITTLANDPNVSLKELMKASRHKSVSAHLQYIRSDHTSESQKIASLLKANNAAPVVPVIKKCKTPDPSDSVLLPLT